MILQLSIKKQTMATTLEKERLKETLREIIQEDPIWFKSIIKEIIQEMNENDPEFELLLKRNFDKYDQTFKALA